MFISYLAYFNQKMEFFTFNSIILNYKKYTPYKKIFNSKFIDLFRVTNFASYDILSYPYSLTGKWNFIIDFIRV